MEEGGYAKHKIFRIKKREKIAGHEFSPCLEEDSAEEEEEMKQQQKDEDYGRSDNENWVSELLATDCEKAWIHAGWEDTLQKWYNWLEEMKKKDEIVKMEEMHQHKVAQMIKIVEASAHLLHKISNPTAWRRVCRSW